MGINPYFGKEKPEGYAPPMVVVRKHCLDCCLDQPGEVRKCPARKCPLHELRMGVITLARPKGVNAVRPKELATSEVFFVWTVGDEYVCDTALPSRKSA
jgi:hypothetical protein